jgi:group II intron reverse transcriptase/maturase
MQVPATPHARPDTAAMNEVSLDDLLSDANLLAGWSKVRENQGGPGVDGETIADFERRLTANLVRLRDEVRFGRYRPRPLLRVMAPKKSGGERPLSIPAVRDRVLQSAAAIVLTPLFEAEFEDVSFAYRRGRSVDQAVVRIELLRNQGYRWVVDADIHRFFDEVDHDLLMKEVGKLVFDEAILHLIRLWIKARVHDGKRRFTLKKGVPQGSPISPMLSNLYLDHLDEALLDENKKIVRFADDFLVLCKSQKTARDALELTEEILDSLRLKINEDKTQVVDFDRGFRFLGVQFIRSLAFKLKHAHEPPLPTIPTACGKRRPSREDESDRLPDNAMAAAFAEAGIEPDQFPPIREPVEPPPESPTHRLDPRLRTLYLLRHGQVLGKESERLVIRYQGRIVAEVPAIKIDQIMVFGNAQITTQAMHFCLSERIPIYLLSAAGRYYGVVDSFDTDPVLLQKAQFGRADDPAFCLRLARHFIRAKIANSRILLKRLARKRSAPGLERAAL